MLTIPIGSLTHVPVLTPKAGSYSVIPASTTYRRGRLYWFQGLQSPGGGGPNPAGWGCPLSLASDGWEVILAPDPADFIDPGNPLLYNGTTKAYGANINTPPWPNALVNDMRDDPLLGGRFVTTLLKSFDNLLARVNADRGWMPSMVGGQSWGAWTSCWIAAQRATLGDGSPLIGFIAIVPPIQLGNVVGFGFDIFPFITTGADLGATVADNPAGPWTSTFLNAVRVPGWVGYGTLDVNAFPGGTEVMVMSGLAAGAPLAPRVIYDGFIIGGTGFASLSFAAVNPSVEDGCAITGPGIPGGTTLSGIVDQANNPSGETGSGPWSATLSQACPNTTYFGITNIAMNGTTWVITTSTPHGMSAGQLVSMLNTVNSSGGFFPGEQPNVYNFSGVEIQSVTTNTITIDNTLTTATYGGITSYGEVFIGEVCTFPGLGPGVVGNHIDAETPMAPLIMGWLQEPGGIDSLYPQVY